jgi:hypothetical protein
MVALSARWACSGFLAVALGVCLLLAGCPAQSELAAWTAPDFKSTAQQLSSAALDPRLAALLDSPPVDPPATGATALANTRWKGTEDCAMTGNVNIVLSGTGTIPLSDDLDFDARGYPSEVYGVPAQFKRASFTETSFDLAFVVVITTSRPDLTITNTLFMMLSGQQSADGREITGQRLYGTFQSNGDPSGDVAVNYDCSFTLNVVEGPSSNR